MEVDLVTSLKRHATKTLSELHAPQQAHFDCPAWTVIQPIWWILKAYEFQQRRMRILEGIGQR